MNWKASTLLLAGLALAVGPAQANQLAQQFVNPVFGGNPFNGPYLTGLAAANNYRYLSNPQTAAQQSGQNSANAFKQQITSSLLSQIASNIGQQITGENAANSGRFVIGGEIIDFNRAGGQINVNILDSASGGTTNIQLPVPNY